MMKRANVCLPSWEALKPMKKHSIFFTKTSKLRRCDAASSPRSEDVLASPTSNKRSHGNSGIAIFSRAFITMCASRRTDSSTTSTHDLWSTIPSYVVISAA
ncbi:hypothetical protein CIHG_05324 [Coccidioides immitis H538.4]|uniref:Uncharacterized protein n=1 Tax=Coccidioides immitis H538.4 TaxID=396776 RepID=A0A0J8UKY9_COCIT|nr:hypothetical protein CIHG_05324 [Coccidioides immitis H538.4]